MIYQAFEFIGFDNKGGREKDPLLFSNWQKGLKELENKGYSTLRCNSCQDGIPTSVLIGVDPQSPLFSTVKEDFYRLVMSLNLSFKSSHFYTE